jgi:hypothetical protein
MNKNNIITATGEIRGQLNLYDNLGILDNKGCEHPCCIYNRCYNKFPDYGCIYVQTDKLNVCNYHLAELKMLLSDEVKIV